MIGFALFLALAATASAGIVPAAPLVAAAPVAAVPVHAPIVTARSSQVVSRNYNTLVAAAPLTYAAPFTYPAPAFAAYAAAPVAYSAIPAHVASAVPAPILK